MWDKLVVARQLRYWSIHVSACAAPSFGFALLGFNALPAVLGMLCAIGTFIVGYTLVSSSPLYQRIAGDTLIGPAVAVGTKIRVVLSLLSGLLFLTTLGGLPLFILAPDYWAGAIAIVIVGFMIGLAGAGLQAKWGNLMEGSSDFLPTYAIAVTEGLILSFTLVLISFFVLLFMTCRKNRRLGTAESRRTGEAPRH